MGRETENKVALIKALAELLGADVVESDYGYFPEEGDDSDGYRHEIRIEFFQKEE